MFTFFSNYLIKLIFFIVAININIYFKINYIFWLIMKPVMFNEKEKRRFFLTKIIKIIP